MESHKKREKLEGSKLYELYREFEAQWYPNEKIPTTLDFLLWVKKRGVNVYT